MRLRNTPHKATLEDKAHHIQHKSSRKELVFSFRDFDHTQGQTFTDWQQSQLLPLLLERLKEYSQKTIPEAQKGRFTIYDRFPPQSDFRHPAYIDKDAVWASLHIQGKECIAGHLVDNIFYIVFLDRYHRFWPSILKHT